MLSTIHFTHSPCHSTSLESIRTAGLFGHTERIISPLSSTPPPPRSLYQFKVNNDSCFTQNHSDNHISLLSLHTTNHLTSLESIMTAASLKITRRIISPLSSTPHPESLYQFRVNNDSCFTQNHSDNHISLLSLHTTNHLTSLESIKTAASLRITQRIISPYSPSIQPVTRPV